jgi:hypothetical protein
VSRLRLTIVCIFGMFWVVGSVTMLFAQQEESNWAVPINLSQSGATISPVMVTDSRGSLHVLWQDNYLEAYKYQFQDDDGWSPAITVTLPFSLSVPRLIVDQNNQMHAFWQYADGEDDKSVSYSRAPVTAVSDTSAWLPIQRLTGDVADYDVVLDAKGHLHLLYIQPDEVVNAPAGVYHSRTIADDAGLESWSSPILLYESPYFRDLSASNANVELATAVSGDDSWLFAAWDNRSRKQIFFTRSEDSGATWAAPLDIVGPESGSSTVIPFNVTIGARDDNVVLVWNRGTPGVSCQQYSISSPDLGVSWNERLLMEDLLPGTASCISQNEFVVGTELMFLISDVQSQQFMWAWNGEHWSPPLIQPILTSFDNPETRNAVVLQCQQRMGAGDKLLVIGCESDVRSLGDGDIWLLSRPFGAADEWFLPPTAWTPFDTVNRDPDTFHSFLLMPGTDDEFLAFWTPASDRGTNQLAIINARMSDGRWLLPETVLTIPHEEIGSPLSAAITSVGQLYLTWTDSLGRLYLAQTDVGNAHIASLWSQFMEIPLEHGVSFPVIGVDDQDVLYLAYTIAVNEGRGVYLISSQDKGNTWGEPIRVFDGEAAGWQVIGPTTMAVAGVGQIYLQWEQRTLLSGGISKTQALYYTHSHDGGLAFAPPSLVTNGLITWNNLVATNQKEIHRFWQTTEDEAEALLHSYSEDGGVNWNGTAVISNMSGSVTVASHQTGSVFVLLLADTAVYEWVWQSNQWSQLARIALDEIMPADTPDQRITAAMSSTSVLATMFVGQATDDASGTVLFDNLYASKRVVATGSDGQLPLPTPVTPSEESKPVVATEPPTAETVPVLTPTVALTATTQTTVVSNLGTPQSVQPIGSTLTLIIGFLPAALLVLVVLGVGVWRMQRHSTKEQS